MLGIVATRPFQFDGWQPNLNALTQHLFVQCIAERQTQFVAARFADDESATIGPRSRFTLERQQTNVIDASPGGQQLGRDFGNIQRLKLFIRQHGANGDRVTDHRLG